MASKIKKALIIQHVPHEGPGIIGTELEKNGMEARFVRVYLGEKPPVTPPAHTLLIVLGGPMGVYEENRYPFIKEEIKLIENAFKAGLPVMGICLGAQLMAKAAGADVYKGKTKEIGWSDVTLSKDGISDRLFLGLPERFKVFQWHGDTFDLPKGATLLASSKDFPNQLIRIGENAYAFQFHLEVTERMIYGWLTEEGNAGELAALKGIIDPEEIKRQTPLFMAALKKYGSAVFSRFLLYL